MEEWYLQWDGGRGVVRSQTRDGGAHFGPKSQHRATGLGFECVVI